MKTSTPLKLKQIAIHGYKSFHPDGLKLEIKDITVLLGANGSGKSNLVSFFKLLSWMMTGALQNFIGESGSANDLLFYGSKTTNRLEAELLFANDRAEDKYSFKLSHAAGDTLIFTEEVLFCKLKHENKPFTLTLDPGLKESGLYEKSRAKNAKITRVIYQLLKSIQVFQFHDTSKEARIRNKGYINDNDFLRSDGGNLAAMLYAMKNNSQLEKYYLRIVRYIQLIMPQFGDFVLDPSPLNENYIILNWKEKGTDYLFGPHQLSDGTMRFMALATLLLQPKQTLPSVVVLDEPELGLHPFAISVLAGMIKSASQNCQLILATQSPRLVDEFDINEIVIVERDAQKRCTIFNQLMEDELRDWLQNYSTSELWEKNVLGGRP
jgi:predicted ATPase